MSTFLADRRTYFFNTSILVSAQLFSKMSERLWIVGVSWYIIEHYDKKILAWFFSISMLPHLFFVFFSGQIIKRFSPYTVVLYSEFIRGLIYLLLFLFVINEQHIFISLLIGTFFVNCASALFNPALLTIPKQMNYENTQKIIAMLNSSGSAARLIGPAIAIPIYTIMGLNGLLLFAGIAYLISWLASGFVRLENNPYSIDSKKLFDIILHPFRILRKYSTITYLLILSFLTNIFLIPLQIFMPIIVKDFYDSNLALLSSFEISLACGLFAGSLLISIYSLKEKPRYTITLPYILSGLAYLLFTFCYISLVSITTLFLLGFFMSIGNISSLNFYQKHTNQDDIPDMMTYANFISIASGPIAMALVGFLLNLISTRLLIIAYGTLSLLAVLSLLFHKNFVSLNE